MCRLLGLVSTTPTTIPETLAGALPGFVELSGLHRDGWGLSWLDTTGPRTIHGLAPAREDATFAFALDAARSREILLHLRWATPGLPVVAENSHPFDDGVIAFAHNGAFSPASQLRQDLRDWNAWAPRGTTDSEVYFAAVRHFGTTMSWPQAIRAAAARISADEARDQVQATHPGGPSLNCILLTGQSMFCYSQYDTTRLLAGLEPDYYEMWIRRDAGSVVVSSSNWQWPDHQVLEPGVVFEIHPDLTITEHR